MPACHEMKPDHSDGGKVRRIEVQRLGEISFCKLVCVVEQPFLIAL